MRAVTAAVDSQVETRLEAEEVAEEFYFRQSRGLRSRSKGHC